MRNYLHIALVNLITSKETRPYLEIGSWDTKMESMPFPFVSGKIVVYLPPFQQTTGTYANRTNRT